MIALLFRSTGVNMVGKEYSFFVGICGCEIIEVVSHNDNLDYFVITVLWLG